ncbi:MAG: DUF4124 domain-containing protein [Pseudomonadales bacterium]
MKSYTKWLLFLFLLFAVGLPLVIKGPNGRPIISFGDWMPNSAALDQVLGQLRLVSDKAGKGVERVAEQTVDSLSELVETPSVSTTVKQSLSSEELAKSPIVFSSSSGKMYKWQDTNGRWHFSSEKPMAVDKVSVEALPDVENVMDTPITEGENSSNIGFPGLGDAGDLLKKYNE